MAIHVVWNGPQLFPEIYEIPGAAGTGNPEHPTPLIVRGKVVPFMLEGLLDVTTRPTSGYLHHLERIEKRIALRKTIFGRLPGSNTWIANGFMNYEQLNEWAQRDALATEDLLIRRQKLHANT